MKNNFLIVLAGGALILMIFSSFSFANTKKQKTDIVEASIAEQLADCLPKSDMASKQKCDAIIASIDSFETCKEAGFLVAGSEPASCRTPDNRYFTNEQTPDENVDAVFCTMDAKVCPDGSYVGRIPPDCEFAPCP
jgi:nucleoside 2-deoxyribosyltransferase